MTIHIQNPSGGPDVTRQNSRNIIYIGNIDASLPGNETTDGSVRFHIHDGDEEARIELRTGGEWNDTSLKVDLSSLKLGDDLTLSGAGGFLETLTKSAPNGHMRALIPHVEFDESGTIFGHMPILDGLETVVLFDNPVSEIISNVIGQVLDTSKSFLLDQGFWLAGSVSASKTVVLTMFVGSDNTGPIFFQRNYSPSIFVANQPVTINFKDDFGIDGDQTYFMEFESSTLFSLQTDVSDNIIMSFLAHELAEQDLVSSGLILAEDLSLTFTNQAELVYGNQF